MTLFPLHTLVIPKASLHRLKATQTQNLLHFPLKYLYLNFSIMAFLRWILGSGPQRRVWVLKSQCCKCLRINYHDELICRRVSRCQHTKCSACRNVRVWRTWVGEMSEVEGQGEEQGEESGEKQAQNDGRDDQ